MLYAISLIPIILYFLLVKGMDGFSLSSLTRVVESFVWGLAVCALLFFIGLRLEIDTIWLSPLLEEVLKALPLAFAVQRKRIAFFAEALIYGVAIGAGFAVLENVLYISFTRGFTLGDAIMRGFGTSLLHMGCTALFGSCLLLSSRFGSHSTRPVRVFAFVPAFLPSFCIHTVYNLFLLPEIIQLFLTVVVLLALFVIIYEIDARRIHLWLDLCISNDVSLLKSIKEGRLMQTPAGEYLMMSRERFKPEVFFDICVYLGLYLELSIYAKSRMILREAQMEIPVSEKEHEDNYAKLPELHALESNIGQAGLLFLRPVIDAKAMDCWVMDSLL